MKKIGKHPRLTVTMRNQSDNTEKVERKAKITQYTSKVMKKEGSCIYIQGVSKL